MMCSSIHFQARCTPFGGGRARVLGGLGGWPPPESFETLHSQGAILRLLTVFQLYFKDQ